MSQQIPRNQFGTGAGKGDWERDVNRAKYRANFDQIDWSKKINKSTENKSIKNEINKSNRS